MVGAAAALGPILGGALTELSWRWIFYVNLPVCVLAVALTLAAVEESRQASAPRPDLVGIALFTLGAGAVVYGLVEAAAEGWGRPVAWVPVAGGLGVLAAWVGVELRRPAPMLDVRLFRSRSFTGIMAGALLFNVAAFSELIYASLWLQSVEGMTPLRAGLVFIPLSFMSFVVAAGTGRVLQARSPRLVLGAGLVLVGVGALLLARVGEGSTWTVLVPGLAVMGVGAGLANPTLASAALAAVPRERSGMASGAVNTARQLGLALGVSVLGLVFTSAAAGVLREGGAPDPAGTASALSGGQAPGILQGADPAARPALADLLSAAYVDGLRDAFLTCGVAGLLGGLLVFWLVRAQAPGAPRRPAPEADRAAAPAR